MSSHLLRSSVSRRCNGSAYLLGLGLAVGSLIVIKQDITAVAIQVFKLVAFHRPKEQRQGNAYKHHGHGDHEIPYIYVIGHKRESLKELVITISELTDMPTMANHGETWPVAASGKIIML